MALDSVQYTVFSGILKKITIKLSHAIHLPYEIWKKNPIQISKCCGIVKIPASAWKIMEMFTANCNYIDRNGTNAG